MKRTTLAAIALAVTAGLGLSGCAGAAGPAEPQAQDGKTRLTVSVWNYEGTPEFKALFDSYEAANPDIDIEPVDILADDYPQKVTTMLAGGDTTDVLTMKNVIDYARYANNGQLQEINGVVDTVGKDNLAGLDAFDISGKYYAAPYRQDFWLLYYNKDLLKAAGVENPADLTWDEYTALAKKLTTEANGKKVYGTYHHIWRSVVQAIAAAQNGADQNSGDYGFFEDQYNTALDLQKSGATLDFGTAKSQKTSYRTMFETGQAAMMPMGTWYIAGILQAKKDGKSTVDWGLAPMPQKNDDGKVTTFGSPTAFAVNKNASHSEEARKFIEWAAGEEGAKAISKIGVVPALQNDAITAEYFKLDGMPTDELSKKAFTPDTVALEMPVSDKSAATDKVLNQEHDLIMVGERSVADGIAEMGKRVKSEVLGQ
ncbi:carbohydrate ABC transporter substrate-binding protein, CUT1 family [Pseudarthrobacter enclensis]|uniref:Sugar ABC transporter substrate-binding protein n=1 Tax=Pseudarthrobacter enclensis TaxID=993070 RepID=A0A0V8IQ15_9MICC|nr:sugar ABC transporter substrate-binding protein [Pseudarthrobacter enclensis]KSU76854.1 sugar ABC transporter substrate-binding protein [Pseudarthrobacter enclensis]SCC03828.1 carbohydrate ABC transporter substrate-binding protein, CUT1 family [Pseudarthrobacter enclensis]